MFARFKKRWQEWSPSLRASWRTWWSIVVVEQWCVQRTASEALEKIKKK